MTNHEAAKLYETKHRLINKPLEIRFNYLDHDVVELEKVVDTISTGRLVIPSFITSIHREIGYNYKVGCLDKCKYTEIFVDNKPGVEFDAQMLCKGMNSNHLKVAFAHPEWVNNINGMFALCKNLIKLEFDNFSSDLVTDLSNLVMGCNNLRYISLKSISTPNVTRTDSMFAGCTNLQHIDLSSLYLPKLEYMQLMFNYCYSLIDLDLSSFKSKAVADMCGAFSNCKILRSINLRDIETSRDALTFNVFSKCVNLIHAQVTDDKIGMALLYKNK